MDLTPLFPFLAGLIPILLARSERARGIASGFGLLNIALGGYYVWCIKHSTPLKFGGFTFAIVASLSITLVSLVVTYIADKK
jgi:hypothetical protein